MGPAGGRRLPRDPGQPGSSMGVGTAMVPDRGGSGRLIPGAVVLCGGRSRRMGQPKAWLPFGPERLLQRVVRLIGRGLGDGPIVGVAAPGQACPALPSSVIVVRDEVSGRGPLQGLATGLRALPETVELAY